MNKQVAADVTYEIRVEPEIDDYVGNSSAIDPVIDADREQWIRDQLACGNDLAWCSVGVIATWGDFEGESWLGTCSYASMDDFRAGGYYSDMKDEALAVLDDRITSAGEQAKEWAGE